MVRPNRSTTASIAGCVQELDWVAHVSLGLHCVLLLRPGDYPCGRVAKLDGIVHSADRPVFHDRAVLDEVRFPLEFSVASHAMLLSLTCLRRVKFACDVASERFLRVHGGELKELDVPLRSVQHFSVSIFDLCPNLSSLALTWLDYSTGIYVRHDFLDSKFIRLWLKLWNEQDEAPPNMNEFLPRKPATSLTKAKFLLPCHIRYVHILSSRTILTYSFLHSVKDTTAQWERFFATFSTKSLPNLSEIQLTCFHWPTTEWVIRYYIYIVGLHVVDVYDSGGR